MTYPDVTNAPSRRTGDVGTLYRPQLTNPNPLAVPPYTGPTGVEIARAQLGTTLAAHSSSATIYRYVVPPLVRDLAIAEAMNTLLQEQAGYARTAGAGENERELSAKGLRALREDVYVAHGRKARFSAI